MRKAFLTLFIGGIVLFSHAQNAADPVTAVNYMQVDSSSFIRLWIDEAMTLALSKDSTTTEKYFEKAVITARRQKNWRLEGEAVVKYADWLFQKQFYNRSFGYYYRARGIYTEFIKEDAELVKALMGMAKTQYHRSVYRKSASILLEAITLSQTLGNQHIEAEATEYLGLVYNAFHNFTASIAYFRRSIEIKTRVGDNKGVVSLAGKLGDIYYERRRYDSALYFSNIAFEGAEQRQLKTEMYNARLTRSATLIRLKKWVEADRELSVLSTSVSKRDANFSVRYQVLKGNYHLAKKEKEIAMGYYDSALAEVRRHGAFPELFGIIYKNMAESYYENGDYQAAFEYSRQYQVSLNDMYAGENLKNLSSIEGILNTDVSRNEIQLLNTENKLKQLELLRELETREGLERENLLMDSLILQEKNLSVALASANDAKSIQLVNEKKLRSTEIANLQDEKRLRRSLLAGLGTILVFGVIILYQYGRQRKKNAIIGKQSDELQTLMKEIHHRVKNNLQVISSLLDLQSMTIKDSQAAEAVKEGKNRVQSMALIHQNLYNEGNIKGIKMENYINNLADSLFHSYNIQPEKIRMRTDIEELNLDVDTVIPIGLIINELVSNSLKYAFQEADQGEILVTLKKQGDGSLLLRVKDNGSGFPDGAAHADSKSFGMKMINAFAQKLKAKLHIYNDNGATVEMHINRYKTA